MLDQSPQDPPTCRSLVQSHSISAVRHRAWPAVSTLCLGVAGKLTYSPHKVRERSQEDAGQVLKSSFERHVLAVRILRTVLSIRKLTAGTRFPCRPRIRRWTPPRPRCGGPARSCSGGTSSASTSGRMRRPRCATLRRPLLVLFVGDCRIM